MKCLRHRSIVQSASAHGDDRVQVLEMPGGIAFVVADGAGGTGRGSQAAEHCIAFLTNAYQTCEDRDDLYWVEILRQVDTELHASNTGGETTCIIIECRRDELWGASVGDSRAFFVEAGQPHDLTVGQVRKPLLGSGNAKPKPIGDDAASGTLIMATDGLWNYAPYDQVFAALDIDELEAIPEKLVSLARLPSGNLQDDIGIVVAEIEE